MKNDETIKRYLEELMDHESYEFALSEVDFKTSSWATLKHTKVK